jgi:hypothetical protein
MQGVPVRKIMWLLLLVLAATATWLLRIEVIYRRNVQNLPTEFLLRRHVITQVWKT